MTTCTWTIDRIHADDLSVEDFMNNYVAQNRPVIILGEVSKWPAFANWCNLDYMKNKIGNSHVDVYYSSNDTFTDYDNPISLSRTFNDIVDEHFNPDIPKEQKKGTKFYLLQNGLMQRVPQLAEDIIRPKFFADHPVAFFNFWCGSGGQYTEGHFDALPNLLCMISGSKTMYLYRPDPTSAFYPRHFASNSATVNIRNPDFKTHPKFKNADGMAVTVNEGEMLFLPPCWWHAVQSSQEPGTKLNIAVNYWFGFDIIGNLKKHNLMHFLPRLIFMRYQHQITRAAKNVAKTSIAALCGAIAYQMLKKNATTAPLVASLTAAIKEAFGSLIGKIRNILPF